MLTLDRSMGVLGRAHPPALSPHRKTPLTASLIGCSLDVGHAQTNVPTLIVETILLILTLAKAVQDNRQKLPMSGIAGLLYRDGAQALPLAFILKSLIPRLLFFYSSVRTGLLYFLIIVGCSIFNIITWSSLRPTLAGLAKL